jgi:N6-L-threonylcarbamoyladenine synthase
VFVKILGIETSCDETSVAVVTDKGDILSNVLYTQLHTHKAYGGVVPEVAARAHLVTVEKVLPQALEEAQVDLSQIDGIAATCGPGLIGGVIVGAMMGKALASSQNLPFLAVNHLAAHVLTARMPFKGGEDVQFPYLCLLMSGGHCQMVMVYDVDCYKNLGSTLDDAVGETFDKVGRHLGFSYPGGPAIEKAALGGDPHRYTLPRPLISRRPSPETRFSFSFSGLKTAARLLLDKEQPLSPQGVSDFCASLQRTVGDILENRLHQALLWCQETKQPLGQVVVAGGVAANQYLRNRLQTLVESHTLRFVAPPVALCTDNGAMVAWAGVEMLRKGFTSPLNFKPRPRWPLETLRQGGEDTTA